MKEPNIFRGRFDDSDDAPASSKSGGRPFSRIFQDIMSHVTEIIRSEVRLARVEVRDDLKQVSNAGVFLVIGAVFALYALGFILLGAVSALETTMAPWLAAVIVGVGAAVVALIFVQVGRTKLKQASLKPDKTIQSLQENVTWMKKQTK
jgi:uncharacterized membrane protein YqjE